MDIFISWSGEKSHQVALLLKNWVKKVIQAVEPWISSKDIDKGTIWFSEISDKLATTKNGIVCLTKENINAPWILFESGALAKSLRTNKLYTLLVDLEYHEVDGPLSQINHTSPTKDGMYQLISTINNSLKEGSLNEGFLQTVFDDYWPEFEEGFKNICESTYKPEGDISRTNWIFRIK